MQWIINVTNRKGELKKFARYESAVCSTYGKMYEWATSKFYNADIQVDSQAKYIYVTYKGVPGNVR